MSVRNWDKSQERGFTLIELLVVIAIIALLMAMIVPAIRKAKAHAQTVVCKTNLKQYSLAMTTYLNDNDGIYPDSKQAIYKTKHTSHLPCQWHDAEVSPENNPDNAGPLWPYLTNMGAHLCPSFKGFAKRYGEAHINHNASIPIEPQYSYSQNHYLGGHNSAGEVVAILKESELSRPAASVAMFVEESMWFMQNDNGQVVASHVLNDTTFWTRHPGDQYYGDSVATYHKNLNVEMQLIAGTYITQTKESGTGNVAFCDGHVEMIEPYEFQEGSAGRFYKSYLVAYPERDIMANEVPYKR